MYTDKPAQQLLQLHPAPSLMPTQTLSPACMLGDLLHTCIYLLISDFKLADYNFFSSKRVFLRYQSHRVLAIELLGFELSGPVLMTHLL